MQYMVEDKADLKPLSNAQQDYLKAVKQFKSDQWDVQADGLKTLRRAIKHSKDVITVDHLPSILEFCESLRSGLAKLALVTLNEFVEVFDLTDKQ